MILPQESAALARLERRFWDLFAAAVDECVATQNAKAPLYDSMEPIWHRLPFGEVSLISIVRYKVSRVVAALRRMGDSDDDIALEEARDIVVYTLFLIALMRLQKEKF